MAGSRPQRRLPASRSRLREAGLGWRGSPGHREGSDARANRERRRGQPRRRRPTSCARSSAPWRGHRHRDRARHLPRAAHRRPSSKPHRRVPASSTAQATNTSYCRIASVWPSGPAAYSSPQGPQRDRRRGSSRQLGGKLVSQTLRVAQVGSSPNGEACAAGNINSTIWGYLDTANHRHIGHPLVGHHNDRIDGLALTRSSR